MVHPLPSAVCHLTYSLQYYFGCRKTGAQTTRRACLVGILRHRPRCEDASTFSTTCTGYLLVKSRNRHPIHALPLSPRVHSRQGGHGIGKLFHTNPNILHYKNNEANGIMKEGHTFTIEPMICEGTCKFFFFFQPLMAWVS